MKNSLKKRANSTGLTDQYDLFPDMPHIVTRVQFPDREVRKRVIIERPAPPPIRRICATCGASFDDYTRRPDTAYCRSWCKTKMSHIKRDTAVETLAKASGIALDAAWLVYDRTGLKAVEKGLNGLGYTFSRERKEWTK